MFKIKKKKKLECVKKKWDFCKNIIKLKKINK